MLTLFTTTKKFLGKNKINQLNAIRSWLQAPYAVEVMILDKVEGEGITELLENSKINIIEQAPSSESNVPYINHMFDIATRHAKYPVLCYLNADIILPTSFFEDVLKIHQSLKKKYLVVGQRIDVDVQEAIDFQKHWESRFFKVHQHYKVHLPSGSDFFVFPKYQYSLDNMPNLLVGRPGWDLWMVYNGLQRNLKVVDLSFSSKVIHQNHDYTHKINVAQKRKKEDEHNYQFLPADQKYEYTLVACNYYFARGKILRNYARGDIELYFRYRRWLWGNSFILKIKNKLHLFQLKLFRKLKLASYIPT